MSEPTHRLAVGAMPQDWTTYDVDDVAAGLQEFLICVEMFFAALAHAQARRPAPGLFTLAYCPVAHRAIV